MLEKLAEDKDEDVRKAAAENENIPTAALEKKTAIDDKDKALQAASFEETVKKINNWISEGTMKDINKFANVLFNFSGLSVTPSHDIHDLCKEIKINGWEIIENIDDDKGESLCELGLTISSDLDIQDIWKYAAIFNTLKEFGYSEIDENVQSMASELSGS